jgi:hypothetical protein
MDLWGWLNFAQIFHRVTVLFTNLELWNAATGVKYTIQYLYHLGLYNVHGRIRKIPSTCWDKFSFSQKILSKKKGMCTVHCIAYFSETRNFNGNKNLSRWKKSFAFNLYYTVYALSRHILQKTQCMGFGDIDIFFLNFASVLYAKYRYCNYDYELCFRFTVWVNLVLWKVLCHCYPPAKTVEEIVSLKSENFVYF